jgi:undecaprenyl-diphosphatase
MAGYTRLGAVAPLPFPDGTFRFCWHTRQRGARRSYNMPRPVRILRERAYLATQWVWAPERRWLVYLAGALAALGTFLEISDELVDDDELMAFDTRVLHTVSTLRLPWLSIRAIDITALGSSTLLGLVMLCAAGALARVRDYRGALQLALSMTGVGAWTLLTKHWFARARPELVYRLLEVQGYSFPSGHSAGAAALYVTLAMVLSSHVRTRRNRTWLVGASLTLATTIGLSRVYLGVHYPSDVVSGLCFGAGWALLLSALFEWQRHRKPTRQAQEISTTSSASDVESVP